MRLLPQTDDSAPTQPTALRPANGIALRSLDNGFVLFSEPQQRVYQCDVASGSVWLGLSAGEPPSRIARRIADEMKCTRDEARDYVSFCLTEWKKIGFLRQGLEEFAQPISGAADDGGSILATGDVYRVAGTPISITFPDASSKQAWDAIAGHLRQGGTCVVEAELAVQPVDGGYRICGRSGERLDFADPAGVAVGLKEAVLHAVLGRRPHWIALHAAVLSSVSGAVLLAGPSGRGKTTLATLLNASGMPAIADDVALVTVRPPGIRGLPFAFAAKPGSWDVLRTQFAALDGLPEFQRPDGRTVKYIEPVRVSEQACSVYAVVFPRFSTATRLRIAQMRKVTALVSLLQEAINARQWLTADGFIALSELIGGAVVMGVEYNDANAAAEWIKKNFAQADQGRTPLANGDGMATPDSHIRRQERVHGDRSCLAEPAAIITNSESKQALAVQVEEKPDLLTACVAGKGTMAEEQADDQQTQS
jgi:hypothetical protein